MKTYYSIGETAKLANTTIETLRHYDRIGLLKPAKVNPESGFRYYTDKELVYLHVIDFCKRNNMPLADIKQLFRNDKYDHVIEILQTIEEKTAQEIERLKKAQLQIRMAWKQYETRLSTDNLQRSPDLFYIKKLKERAIVKIDTLERPTIENFHQIDEGLTKQTVGHTKDAFVFEDSIHLFTTHDSQTSFFVICKDYPAQADCVSYLPAGNYLNGVCSEQQRELTIRNLIQQAKVDYDVNVSFIIQSIIFTGIFQWDYEVQVFLK